MKLTIDNLDGRGPRDYSAAIDGTKVPQYVRKLNRATELRVALVSNTDDFVVPVVGARVVAGRLNGHETFSGYVVGEVEHEYLGYGEKGPIYRYKLVVLSDESSLDQRTIPLRPPFVARAAGEALRCLTDSLLPDAFDTTAMENGDFIGWYACRSGKRWSDVAADMAILSRACYRVDAEGMRFAPVGSSTYALDESADNFSPSGLTLRKTNHTINDLTVIGNTEPSMYVKDYFVGDGFSLKFYLSQVPFTRSSRTLVDEEYSSFDSSRWLATDPSGVVSISGGKLVIAGGDGVDGATRLEFSERMELAGALILQHGDIQFQAASTAVIGGLYEDNVVATECLAGFLIAPVGVNSRISVLIEGSETGTSLTTQTGRRYVLTTRVYASEVYRTQQLFHSSVHPAGAGRGGPDVNADARVVLEVHEVDPSNPGSFVAPSTVLYEGVVAQAPAFCRYALINAQDLHCSVAFTRLTQAVDAVVRSAAPGEQYKTRLTGSLVDGAECRISEEPSLTFYPQHVPAANELITVSYRGRGRARARVTDPVSVVAHRHGTDDGVRGEVRHVLLPPPRTSVDCEYAALALLDDATEQCWSGEYQTWSAFLPEGAQDIYPGDALHVHIPTQGADFRATVLRVDISLCDLETDNAKYTIYFADEGSVPLGFAFGDNTNVTPSDTVVSEVQEIGQMFLPPLSSAEIVQVTSTSVTIDAGIDPQFPGGVEVRRTDAGWGTDNDRNLVGRFTSRTFNVPRLGRVQDFYLRQYDANKRYSRYSAGLHLDFPL